MTTKIKLHHVRLSFPVLWTAEQYQGAGPFRYSATFLIEPGSANDKLVLDAIQAEAVRTWDKRANAMLESIRGNSNKFCYVKGDSKPYEGYVGMMALSSHRKADSGRPIVASERNTPLNAEDGKPYAGCFVNASVELFAQTGQNMGMRCALLGVQFEKDGDAFSAGSKPSLDDFADISAGADASDVV